MSDIPLVLNSTITAKGQQVSVGWDELSPRRRFEQTLYTQMDEASPLPSFQG